MTVRGRRFGEGGFALTVVLGVMLLTSLTLLAMLGYGTASARLARAQASEAAARRAADGALEAAVATLTRSTARTPCSGFPSAIAFDPPTGPDGTQAAVTCEDPSLADGPATNGQDTTQSPALKIGAPDVKLVGSASVQPAGGAALQSTGALPLNFDAQVTVRGGASLTNTGTGPAIKATGSYTQGQAGPDASGANRCGSLGDPASASFVEDGDSKPVCDDENARALNAAASGLAPRVDRSPPVDVPMACPVQPVVELGPGRYGTAQVKALTALLGGGCPRTYWFRPGVHSFDSSTGELVINDPNASVVFGEPSGWTTDAGATAANFPKACDPTSSGASIQLSARTALKHRKGRVAVCPVIDPGPPPVTQAAITQVPWFTVDPFVASVEPTNWPGGAAAATLLGSDPKPGVPAPAAEATFDCEQYWAPCVSARSFAARFTDVDSEPLRSARVLVVSAETPQSEGTNQNGRFTNRQVQLSVNGNGVSCSTDWQRAGRTYWQKSAYDLLNGGCSTLLGRSGNVLDGAAVTVSYRILGQFCTNWLGIYFNCGKVGTPQRIAVRGVRLVTNPSFATAKGPIESGNPGWGAAPAADAVLVDGGAPVVASPARQPCSLLPTDPRCTWETPLVTRSITIGDFNFAGSSSIPGTDRVSSLHAVVKSRVSAPPASGEEWAPLVVSDGGADRTTISFELSGVDGPLCSATYPGYSQSDQETWYDLFNGDCATKDLTGASLQASRLAIRVTPRCVGSAGTADGALPRPCANVPVPDLQYVTLAATTDVLSDSPTAGGDTSTTTTTGLITGAAPRGGPSLVTVDAANGSTFHVFGPTVMPRSDLEIQWRGSKPSSPLFAAGLVLNGLRSKMFDGASMGVVCCDPGINPLNPGEDSSSAAAGDGSSGGAWLTPKRLVLTAEVGGVTAKAGVLVGPLNADGSRDITILDWRL
jgi:hypothetical protein